LTSYANPRCTEKTRGDHSTREAKAYCELLDYGGVKGWRLPVKEDFKKLVEMFPGWSDGGPTVDTRIFPDDRTGAGRAEGIYSGPTCHRAISALTMASGVYAWDYEGPLEEWLTVGIPPILARMKIPMPLKSIN